MSPNVPKQTPSELYWTMSMIRNKLSAGEIYEHELCFALLILIEDWLKDHWEDGHAKKDS
jgi:hypothetical protein